MRTSKHKITFADPVDQNAVALAQLGQTNDSIRYQTQLTDGQINYRLRKAKDYNGGMANLRRQWRSGESMLFKRVRDDMLVILRKEVQRTLPVTLFCERPNGKIKTG